MRWATNKRLHFELGVIQAVQNYNEVSLTLGNNRRLANARSFVRGGISYLDGQGDVRGLRVKLGYWF